MAAGDRRAQRSRPRRARARHGLLARSPVGGLTARDGSGFAPENEPEETILRAAEDPDAEAEFRRVLYASRVLIPQPGPVEEDAPPPAPRDPDAPIGLPLFEADGQTSVPVFSP